MVYKEVGKGVVKNHKEVKGVDKIASFLAIKRLQKYYKNKLAFI